MDKVHNASASIPYDVSTLRVLLPRKAIFLVVTLCPSGQALTHLDPERAQRQRGCAQGAAHQKI